MHITVIVSKESYIIPIRSMRGDGNLGSPTTVGVPIDGQRVVSHGARCIETDVHELRMAMKEDENDY